MSLNVTTLGTELLANFNNTTIIGLDWVLGLALTFLVMLIITRNIEKWKVLAFPIMIQLKILGIHQNIIIWLIAVILFATNIFSPAMLNYLTVPGKIIATSIGLAHETILNRKREKDEPKKKSGWSEAGYLTRYTTERDKVLQRLQAVRDFNKKQEKINTEKRKQKEFIEKETTPLYTGTQEKPKKEKKGWSPLEATIIPNNGIRATNAEKPGRLTNAQLWDYAATKLGIRWKPTYTPEEIEKIRVLAFKIRNNIQK